MAFNFLGTFTAQEVEALLAFAQAQLEDVQDQIQYLQSQIQRIGWIQYTLDEENMPASFSVSPSGSLLARQIKSFQYYGGDILDLKIRSRGQWVSFSQEEPSLDSSKVSTSGSLIAKGTPVKDTSNLHADDAVPAIAVYKVKEFILPAIQRKREHFEFKIKKSVDLTDQYLEQIILLVRRATGGDESLDYLKTQIQFYLNDPEFQSATKR